MYSQHYSENPVRTNPQKNSQTKTKLISKLSSLFKADDQKGLSHSFKSVLVTMLSIVMFVGCIMGAFTIDERVNAGFKPDFQNNQRSYSSRNALFNTDGDVKVTLSLYGKEEIEISSPIVTVGELIENNSIELDTDDVINYSEEDDIFNGMRLCIDKLTQVTYTQKIEIPYSTLSRNSQTVPKGTTRVTTKGINGSVTETVTEYYKNGELINSESVTDASSTVAPVDEIVETGIGGVYTDSNGISYEYSYYMDVTATAYGTGSGITASGKAVDFGMIAVDPSVIPLGTKVYLTGSSYGDMGVHSAEDTGSGIKGNRIDVFLGDDYDTLMQFGRRTMRIYILA